MKQLFLLALITCASCSVPKNLTPANESDVKSLYKINRIKRLDGWNVLYAKKGDSTFKIITKDKPAPGNGVKIKKGRNYNLELHWILENDNPPVNNYADLGCFDYGPKLKICTEPKKRIYKLYYTLDITGLYYTGNK